MEIGKNRELQVLALIILLGLGLRLAGSALFPIGAGPEEPSHLFYIGYIAENGVLPNVPLNEQTVMSIEKEAIYQPPLYYMVAAPFYSLVAGQGEFAIVHFLRLLSVAFGTACIALTYSIAKRMRFAKIIAVGSALFIALLPTHVIVSSTLGNSALSWALCLGTVYFCILAIQEKRAWYMAAAGLLMASAVLAKYTSMSVAIAFAIAAIVFLLKGKGNFFKRIAVCAIPLVAIAIPFRNLALYDSLMPSLLRKALPIDLGWLYYFSTHIFAGIWLQEYGAATIPGYRFVFFGFYAVVSAAALAGFVGLLISKEWPSARKRLVVAMLLLPVLLNLAGVAYMNFFGLWTESSWLFATIGLAAILFIAGLAKFAKMLGQEKRANTIVWAVLATMLLLDIIVLINYNATLPAGLPWM